MVLTNCGLEERNDGGGGTKTSVCILSRGGGNCCGTLKMCRSKKVWTGGNIEVTVCHVMFSLLVFIVQFVRAGAGCSSVIGGATEC